MKNKSRWFRYSVQIFFFIFVGMLALNHVLSETGPAPFPFLPEVSLHAVCPFGGVESILSLISSGTLVPKLHESTIVISALVILLTLILGSVFCSYVCPLGAIQEWIGKIGKKIFKKRYNKFIPQKLHDILKYLRYVSLLLTVVLTYKAATLVFLEVDPYYALYHFFTDEVTIGSLIVLGAVLIGSLFVERPWCKYLCPYGAFLGLISKISIFKIKKKASKCDSCTLCDKQCPMNIEISKKKVIGDPLCIRCMDCVEDDNSCHTDALVYTAKSIKKLDGPGLTEISIDSNEGGAK